MSADLPLPDMIETDRDPVIGFTSFAEAVRVQIAHKKVRVPKGIAPDHLAYLAAAFEGELVKNGFTHKHYGCGKVEREVVSIFTRKGVEWRVWLTDRGSFYLDDYVEAWKNLFPLDLTAVTSQSDVVAFVATSIRNIR